jgi:hypothetical protein
VVELNEVQFEITIDKLFTQSKSGAIWGRICFKSAKDWYFPSMSWSDMPIAFVVQWLSALFHLSENETSSISFYDGPFAVDLISKDGQVVELVFLHDESVEFTAKESLDNLMNNACHTARELLRACEERNWTNPDIESLSTLLMKVRKY